MLLRQGAVHVHSEGVLRIEVRTIQNGVLSFVNKCLRKQKMAAHIPALTLALNSNFFKKVNLAISCQQKLG